MESFIRKLESFGLLSEDDKVFVRDLAVQRREIDADADIISEGDRPSDVHLIETGLACRYKLLSQGRRQIVAYLVPGDFCDLHVFILKAMDHGIATFAPCTVIDIPRASILKLLERPALSRGLLMATLVDEATLREWLANIGQRRAVARIAHLFCELHARLRVVGLAPNDELELPITQAELSDTVGLSPVHTNRSLQTLRARRLITFKSGRLHIPDVSCLRSMCGFTSNYLHLAAPGEAEGPDSAALLHRLG